MVAFFLQILGAMTLFFLLMFLAGFVWVGWGIRRMFQNLQQMSVSNPVRVRLIPALTQDWGGKIQEIQSLGFETIGDFRVEGMPEVRLWGAVNSLGYAAILYRHEQAGDWFDFVAEWEDGHVMTVSNAPLFNALDTPPFSTKIAAHELSLADAYEVFQNALRERQTLAKIHSITLENFPQRFAEAYAKEMDWRLSRGGPTSDEIRRVAAASPNLPPLSDRQFAQADDQIHQEWRQKLDTACLDTFLETAPISLKRWEQIRDRLLIVHEKLDEDTLVSMMESWVEVDLLPNSAQSDDDFDPILFFATVNATLPKVQQFQCIGEVTQPVRAVFYIYEGVTD